MGEDLMASRELSQTSGVSGGDGGAGLPSGALIVGFTGTRDRITQLQHSALAAWFRTHPKGTFHHGDCIGADAAAHEAALYNGWRIEAHPGDGPSHLRAFCMGCAFVHPPKPYLARNTDIVDAANLLIACPSGPETMRSGTWSTIRKARRRKIPRTIIWPDGTVTIQPGEASLRADTSSPAGDGESSRDEPISPTDEGTPAQKDHPHGS